MWQSVKGYFRLSIQNSPYSENQQFLCEMFFLPSLNSLHAHKMHSRGTKIQTSTTLNHFSLARVRGRRVWVSYEHQAKQLSHPVRQRAAFTALSVLTTASFTSSRRHTHQALSVPLWEKWHEYTKFFVWELWETQATLSKNPKNVLIYKKSSAIIKENTFFFMEIMKLSQCL